LAAKATIVAEWHTSLKVASQGRAQPHSSLGPILTVKSTLILCIHVALKTRLSSPLLFSSTSYTIEETHHDRPSNVRFPPSQAVLIPNSTVADISTRPGQEGPSFAPPPLPGGWIAQWDGMSRKYYFVQLSTGASQWDTPTHAAPTGPTPQPTPQGVEHPYGTPGQESGLTGREEILENGDGTRSVRFEDGRVEQIPPDGDRGLGVSWFRFRLLRVDFGGGSWGERLTSGTG
jgi:hypothetical protein